MQKETVQKTDNTSPLEALKIARQVRAIKRAVLHNVEHGVTDMPARGLASPFTLSLHKETVDRLNKKLEDYDVKVDAYKLNVRGKLVDRIAVTRLDNALVEPSPAYQTALQTRLTAA
jgi:hypothetical protein